MSSLYQDLAVVYGHVVLPSGVSHRLPSVTETWQDFGKEHTDAGDGGKQLAVKNDADVDRAVGEELWADQRASVERYIDSIEPTKEPTLFFVHEMLPHSPWRFLPSGRQYADALGIDGIADDRWGDDEWLVQQGWQRHLLQVGLVDRLLGQLIDRLERDGLYDRSLVIVTADHGVSFHPGDRRRGRHADEHRGHRQRAALRQATRPERGRDRRPARPDDRHRPDDRRRPRAAAAVRGRRRLALRSGRGSRRGGRAPARRRLGVRARRRGGAPARRVGRRARPRSSAPATGAGSTPSGRTRRSWGSGVDDLAQRVGRRRDGGRGQRAAPRRRRPHLGALSGPRDRPSRRARRSAGHASRGRL